MHRALENADVLLEIFEHLSPRNDSAVLSAAARVCRSFCGPALDVLWSELDDLVPLFQLLHALELRYRRAFVSQLVTL